MNIRSQMLHYRNNEHKYNSDCLYDFIFNYTSYFMIYNFI